MIPANIERWGKFDWDNNVYFCAPSGGGAVGVTFVWLAKGKTWIDRKNFSNPSTADFVIKPIQGSAAPTKFAERILKNVAGAASPRSRGITKISPCGIALLNKLKYFRDLETDPARKNRWKEVWHNYFKAETFLIQELQSGLEEVADLKRKAGGLDEILKNHPLIRNMGKLFAADALIGNGDRLDRVNSGNIMFGKDGKLSAIDSTTVLTKFNAVLSDRSGAARFEEENFNLDRWLSSHLHRNGGQQVPTALQQRQFTDYRAGRAPKDISLAPSFRMASIFDIREAWDGIKGNFLKFDQETKFQPTVSDERLWESAFLQFKLGFEEGTREIDRQLSGLNWMKLKSKYKDYVKRFGGDPNLDWNNLKIRRRYFKLLKNGKNAKDALDDIKDYAKTMDFA